METLRKENSANELMFAAKMKMQASGNRNIVKVISFLIENLDQKYENFAKENILKKNLFIPKTKR